MKKVDGLFKVIIHFFLLSILFSYSAHGLIHNYYDNLFTDLNLVLQISKPSNIAVKNPLINNKCILCKVTIRSHNQNSSPKDVIIGSAFVRCRNYMLVVRTLRSIGCLAQFFMIVDKMFFNQMPKENIEFLENCGCHIINVGKNEIQKPMNLHYYRYFCYKNFLEKKTGINRVMSLDIYDAVFQGDPFTTSIESDSMYYTTEAATINSNGCNANWVRYALNNSAEYPAIKNKFIVNGGIMLGGYKPYMCFVKLFLNYTKYSISKSFPIGDQGFINVIAYRNMVAQHGFKQYVLTYENGYANLFLMTNMKLNWTFGKVKSYKNQEYFLILHQIYRIPALCRSIVNICPPLKYMKNGYLDCAK